MQRTNPFLASKSKNLNPSNSSHNSNNSKEIKRVVPFKNRFLSEKSVPQVSKFDLNLDAFPTLNIQSTIISANSTYQNENTYSKILNTEPIVAVIEKEIIPDGYIFLQGKKQSNKVEIKYADDINPFLKDEIIEKDKDKDSVKKEEYSLDTHNEINKVMNEMMERWNTNEINYDESYGEGSYNNVYRCRNAWFFDDDDDYYSD
jgi:hypothetical protein